MAFWTKKEGDGDTNNNEAARPENAPAVTVLSGLMDDEPKRYNQSNNIQVNTPSFGNDNSDEHDTSSPEERIAARFGGKLRSVLSAGTIIQGKLSFDTPVRIDGKLSGEVYSSRALIVGTSGCIDANVQVQSLVVLGRIKGKITATERIEIFPGGIVEGEVRTGSLSIDGGVLNGSCSMDVSTAADGVAADLKLRGTEADKSRSDAREQPSTQANSQSNRNSSTHKSEIATNSRSSAAQHQ